MLIYALLHLTGYDDMTMDAAAQLPPAGRDHRRPPRGSDTQRRHRDHHRSARPGASPMRSAWRWRNITLPPSSARDLVDHFTYVIAGDGCLMEGDQPRGGFDGRPYGTCHG